MRTTDRTRRLAERLAELEQRKLDEAQRPNVIFLVGVNATHQEETLAALLVLRGGSMLRLPDEPETDFCARVMERAAV